MDLSLSLDLSNKLFCCGIQHDGGLPSPASWLFLLHLPELHAVLHTSSPQHLRTPCKCPAHDVSTVYKELLEWWYFILKNEFILHGSNFNTLTLMLWVCNYYYKGFCPPPPCFLYFFHFVLFYKFRIGSDSHPSLTGCPYTLTLNKETTGLFATKLIHWYIFFALIYFL